MKPRIVAVMPVSGREELFGRTIARLCNQIDVDIRAIAVCDDAAERFVAQRSSSSIAPEAPGLTLAGKWIVGLNHAMECYPDAVLIASSAVWYTDGYVAELYSYLDEYDYVGMKDMYCLDFRESGSTRLMYWGGYHGKREGDSLGAGRLISRRILDKCDWNIVDPTLNKNIDRSMTARMRAAGAKPLTVGMNHEKMLKISSWKWKNINSFMALLNNPNAHLVDDHEKWVEKYFPETKELFR